MKVYRRGKSLNLSVKKVNFFGKFVGLMFKSKNTGILMFDFGRKNMLGIHSYFVFFPFLAVWLDGKDEVLESRIIKPFTFIVKPKSSFVKLIEVPINNKNLKIIDFFVDRGKI